MYLLTIPHICTFGDVFIIKQRISLSAAHSYVGQAHCCGQWKWNGKPGQAPWDETPDTLKTNKGAGCSTVVEHMPGNREVMGLNLASCSAFSSLLYTISSPSLIRYLTEVQCYWFSYKKNISSRAVCCKASLLWTDWAKTTLHKHYTTKVVSIKQSQKANLVLRLVKLQTGHFTLTIKNNGLSGRMDWSRAWPLSKSLAIV